MSTRGAEVAVTGPRGGVTAAGSIIPIRATTNGARTRRIIGRRVWWVTSGIARRFG